VIVQLKIGAQPVDSGCMRLGIGGRSNGVALALLILPLVLLPVLASAILSQDEQRRTSEDRALVFEAAEQAANVEDYFARSRALTQILAKNPAFADFYEQPGARTDKIRAQIRAVRGANEALAHLETLFPGSIGEACFIDAGGPENARAIRGRIEPLANLSPDETGASFFAPTFQLRADQVYQSRPYVSPDTNEWVIANSAPIELPGRPTPAIVHFEVTLESLRRAATALGETSDVQIVDARSGEAILDTRYRYVGSAVPAGLRALARALPDTRTLGAKGLLTVGGHRLAYRRLPNQGENANDWIVVARSRTQAAGWAGTVSTWQWGLMALIASLIPLSFVGWRRSQTELSRAANTDGLTGLGNRRRLSAALDEATTSASADRPFLLAIYDLDGFKLYNDTYGHPAGDALLARLARQLTDSIEADAHAYRMGGDEFCVISPLGSVEDALDVAAHGADALSEHGEGFTVSASYGAVLLPVETSDATEALRLADQRMYAQKSSSRMSATRQATDVLVQTIGERSAQLGEHVSEVVLLADGVSRRLGLRPEQVEEVRDAAALHDIGKLAIPESILMKAGPLSAAEWEFVRQHTVIGERILSAAPSLRACARIVRASHERWDGDGYPDGLAGEDIPLAARIVFVCDAYQAMTSTRPYRERRSVEEARAELQRCAGSQFDPGVVQAFLLELDSLTVEQATL
jgi:diguanylate cyclase (GGDEF)-like protein